MDVGLQTVAESGFDIFFMGEVHVDRSGGGFHLKRYAGYECVTTVKEDMKVAGRICGIGTEGFYKGSDGGQQFGGVESGDVRVGGVYWQPKRRTEDIDHRLAELGHRLVNGRRVVIRD